ncbi:MAG: transporter [Caulobacter sp.]|jgi:predicted MFS family arabinose efflux permease|nr:transporter [Caulobacter sp.]
MTQTLWRHGDFLKLWAAQAVSAFGSRITREGLPIAAIFSLDAKPAELGVLAALSLGPGVILGLFAGGWADRNYRRPILIGADILRALLLLSVPIAAWMHWLSMPQLYLVAAAVGASSLMFAIADHAYLPSLVGREQLLEANTKLGVTESVAEIGGPALAGLLFKYLTAPFALLINAATYLASAIFLWSIRTPEPPPEPSDKPRHPFSDLMFGVRAIWRQPLVRPLLIMTVVQTVFSSFFWPLYALFALKTLGLTTDLLGVVIALGGVGALLGVVIAPVTLRLMGVGPAIIWLGLAAAASAVVIPLAPASVIAGAGFLIIGQILGDGLGLAAIIPAGALRQSVFDQAKLGRTGAVFHVARGAMTVIGALVGGLLGEAIGVRNAMWVAVIGMVAAGLIPVFSPLRTLKAMPEGEPQSP